MLWYNLKRTHLRGEHMDFEKISNDNLSDVSGGDSKEFLNTCKECGKVWDMRDYGYGTAEVIPEWVTAPWCPECRKKLANKHKNSKSSI